MSGPAYRLTRSVSVTSALAAIGMAAAAIFVHDTAVKPVFGVLAIVGLAVAILKGREAQTISRKER